MQGVSSQLAQEWLKTPLGEALLQQEVRVVEGYGQEVASGELPAADEEKGQEGKDDEEHHGL